jgi:hypothetical protein
VIHEYQPGDGCGRFGLPAGCGVGVDVQGETDARMTKPIETQRRLDSPKAPRGKDRSPVVPPTRRFGASDLTDGYDFQMTRVVVAGNGGGCKSTLACALAEHHDLVCCLLGNL